MEYFCGQGILRQGQYIAAVTTTVLLITSTILCASPAHAEGAAPANAVTEKSTADNAAGNRSGADTFVIAGACRVFDYDTNFPVGHPVQTSYVWTGACDAAGLASGPGELRAYWNGKPDEITQGTMQQGRLEGHALTMASSGAVFDGLYQQGRRNGYGVLSGMNVKGIGFRYEGNFSNGNPNGTGKEIFSNGDRYAGEFAAGLRSGHGIMQWADGSRYAGQFHNDHASGPGLLMRANSAKAQAQPDIASRQDAAGQTETQSSW